ncbi:MAG: hypothetical protein FJ404_00735 [Verrucomicrobia bacterium]|nr:hypothetical protein [Verrucomicrobiota bacterium]
MKETSSTTNRSVRLRLLRKFRFFAWGVLGCCAVLRAQPVVSPPANSVGSSEPWATHVTAYVPGSGFAVEFGSGLGYTNSSSILGLPSRVTSGAFGGPVDPFAPPFLVSQLLSVGATGSITVELGRPAFNNPAHPHGVDFLVFGNTGFTITNGNFTGGGITDGSLFSAGQGVGRVSVSPDGLNFFTLDPAKAPALDSLFPTDGSGEFHQAVDPRLSAADFAGLSLAGIRDRYAGSGGGTGFDLAWAVDAQGRPALVDYATHVRIETLSGQLELDAITVIPEPGVSSLLAIGLVAGALMRWRRLANQARS